MRSAAMSPATPSLVRQDKMTVQDYLHVIEELWALKHWAQNMDLARVKEQCETQVLSAVKSAEQRARPEDLERLQKEARKYVEAEHERTREMLQTKFQRLEAGLLALQNFLTRLAPLKDLEARLTAQEEQFRRLEEELAVRRKVCAQEEADLQKGRVEMKADREALAARSREVDAQALNLDVAKRAGELDQLKEELDGKVKAYVTEMTRLEKQREELNRDFDQLGKQRALLDGEAEGLKKKETDLREEKKKMAEVVAREMAATFESFVRDMLRPPEKPVRPDIRNTTRRRLKS